MAGLVFVFIVLFTLCFYSEGSQGSADSFKHFRISKYAFSYPHLFFDHWGKPFFILLSSPFAQFGFTGIRLFNILIGLSSAWLVYKTARMLGLKLAFTGALFALASPFYTSILLSGLTEPLFGLILIVSAYLFLKEKYIPSIIVISIIPFVRTEGFIFFPLFVIALALRQKWKVIPFLLFGFIAYSLAGYPFTHDIFWVINDMPYTGAGDIYGKGSFWHFFSHAELIFGLPLLILLIGGILYLCVRYLKNLNNSTLFIHLLLIPAPIIGYFMAHTLVRWIGVGNSIGLTRVITGIMPLAGLCGVYALQVFFQKEKTVLTGKILAGLFSIWCIVLPFTTDKFPVQLSKEEVLLKKVGVYLSEKHANEFMIYYNPTISFFMDFDPYDASRSREQVVDYRYPARGMKPGTLILWDSHFGPNEGRLPLEKLKNPAQFELLQSFYPEQPFTVLGGHNYEIHLFRKKE